MIGLDGSLGSNPPGPSAEPLAFAPELAGLLKDADPMVRGRAIQALLQIDAREYMREVEGLLGDSGRTSVPDDKTREWVALEVREVASRALEAWKATGDKK